MYLVAVVKVYFYIRHTIQYNCLTLVCIKIYEVNFVVNETTDITGFFFIT